MTEMLYFNISVHTFRVCANQEWTVVTTITALGYTFSVDVMTQTTTMVVWQLFWLLSGEQ